MCPLQQPFNLSFDEVFFCVNIKVQNFYVVRKGMTVDLSHFLKFKNNICPYYIYFLNITSEIMVS